MSVELFVKLPDVADSVRQRYRNDSKGYMTTLYRRHGLARTTSLLLALLTVCAAVATAQPMRPTAEPIELLAPPPPPADVLTPNTRQNTPYIKIGVRGGFNWAAYSNDRYLDNTQLDVGRTSGENDIYEHAAGFGFGGGFEVEYPINTALSVVGTAEFSRARFGKQGLVSQECASADGSGRVSPARHAWNAELNYLKIGAVAKIGFPTFYVVAGLTGSRLLSSTVERTRTFDDPTCRFLNEGDRSSIVESGELLDPAAIHFALRTGFGLIYPIADGLQFSPELTLDFGLDTFNKSPESDLDIYTLSAVLRYELR